ncbi:hypothetical protein QOZ80_4AG0308250 [Eleusine coracana subsp. coracana]|nr:hypothetical protein QOZ80_4AG0308250 [Eleusine coracana subsp. coracana]
MHWAGSSGYPQPFAPRADGGSIRDEHHRQQEQEQQAWLNLGKRPCCWAGGCQQVQQQPSCWGGSGSTAGGGSGITAAAEGKRKEKATVVVPRCQVEGCHVALTGVKEYHRRHKVCEAHSKAPRVVVLGAEQRFCQQCSRFHAISEFDDAKRSCRRRLAGHNERRRKSNASEAMARSAGHPHGMMPFGFPPCGLPTSPAGALSLLSSARGGAPWLIPAAADISARSSAALDELIAENRASLLAWQFFSDRSPGRVPVPMPMPSSSIMGRVLPGEAPGSGWQIQAHLPGEGGFEAPSGGHTTLDLMQTAGAPFRPVPERAAKKDGDDAGCSGSDAWASSVEGAPGRVV